MKHKLENMEQLVNLILAMNAPRKQGDAPVSSCVTLPTEFGKLTVSLIEWDFVSDDPSLKKLKAQNAKNASLAEVVRQTLGNYREVYRRALAATTLNIGPIHEVKAKNTTIWLLEGQTSADQPDAQNKKWKVVAMASFELPGEQEIEIEIS